MIYALCIFVSHYPKPPIFVKKMVKICLLQFESKSQFLARKFKDFVSFSEWIIPSFAKIQFLNKN